MALNPPDRESLAGEPAVRSPAGLVVGQTCSEMLHSVAVRFAPFVFRAVNDPVLLVGDALAEGEAAFPTIAMRLALLAVLATAATGGLLIFHLSTGAERLDLTDLPVIAAIGLVSALIGAIIRDRAGATMSRPIRSVARAAARYAPLTHRTPSLSGIACGGPRYRPDRPAHMLRQPVANMAPISAETSRSLQ